MTLALQILRAAERTVPRQRSPWFTERIWADGDNNLVLSLRFYGQTGLNGPCAKWLTVARWGEWVEIHRSVARLILDGILAGRIHEKQDRWAREYARVRPAVGAAANCAVCGLRKKPRGRSAPLEMANSLCDFECPGYDQDPEPGDLWPGETREEFGY